MTQVIPFLLYSEVGTKMHRNLVVIAEFYMCDKRPVGMVNKPFKTTRVKLVT